MLVLPWAFIWSLSNSPNAQRYSLPASKAHAITALQENCHNGSCDRLCWMKGTVQRPLHNCRHCWIKWIRMVRLLLAQDIAFTVLYDQAKLLLQILPARESATPCFWRQWMIFNKTAVDVIWRNRFSAVFGNNNETNHAYPYHHHVLPSKGELRWSVCNIHFSKAYQVFALPPEPVLKTGKRNWHAKNCNSGNRQVSHEDSMKLPTWMWYPASNKWQQALENRGRTHLSPPAFERRRYSAVCMAMARADIGIVGKTCQAGKIADISLVYRLARGKMVLSNSGA